MGFCIPHISPGFALARMDTNVSYHYANQPIWLQYDVRQILSQLFLALAALALALAALAQFGYFTLKTRVWF